MKASIRIDCEMRVVLPATLQATEDFCAEFRLKTHTLLSRADRFAAELLIREVLTNAVVHGCDTDPHKQVRCSLRIKRGRLLIAVNDDGEGFDWRGAWGNSATSSDCSGRGVEILRKYADRVRYNDRGNAVTLFKRL